ncbi:MAG: glucose 1-dehydrogenase [Ardenticatenaceae bacterium]|nr:glucose 1-dehydrogenase [Ardenticatenaceae bacterium]
MAYPMFRLDGQVALITGASRGIGHDLTLALAAAGAQVVPTARTVSDLDGLVAEVERVGGQALPVQLDVRDPGSIESAVQKSVSAYGRVDILVNNAGLGYNHDAIEVTEADWDEMMDVNLKGLFFVCQAVGRRMIEQRYGRIINMSSQAGSVGIRRHAVYCASKGGVNLLTKVLALEWAPYGITVNAVAPTFIRTPGTAERLDDPAFLADVLARLPVGHVGTPMDVAGAVIYLASPSTGLVTGTVLLVDGGWTAQ